MVYAEERPFQRVSAAVDVFWGSSLHDASVVYDFALYTMISAHHGGLFLCCIENQWMTAGINGYIDKLIDTWIYRWMEERKDG